MQNKKYFNSFDFESTEIKPNDTFNSLFGENVTTDKFQSIKIDPKFKILNEKYIEIFKAGEQAGIYQGETQILIQLYSNGKDLHEIEFRRLDDCRIFVSVNANKLLSFIDPETHAFLLTTKYFQKNPKEMTSGHRLNRISKILKNLMSDKQSLLKLKKFSEILSRL